MVLGILINWDHLGGGSICVYWHQYFFLKYNQYYFVLINILEMPQVLMSEYTWISLVYELNVYESNVSNNPMTNQWDYSVHVGMYVHMCLLGGGVGGDICWCMNECDKGVREGDSEQYFKEEKHGESHQETFSQGYHSPHTVFTFSLCMLSSDKVN